MFPTESFRMWSIMFNDDMLSTWLMFYCTYKDECNNNFMKRIILNYAIHYGVGEERLTVLKGIEKNKSGANSERNKI